MSAKPRSLIMDLFGDYLRYADGEVRLSSLTRLLGSFEVEQSNARVTLARLRKEGWFTTRREGRGTIYKLSDSMLDILSEGRERIFYRSDTQWDGRWTMVLYQVPESARSTRESLRKVLAWLGFGQLSPSLWIAANDLTEDAQEIAARHPQASVDVMWCGTDTIAKDRELATRCWALENLAADYHAFITKYAPLDDAALNNARDGEEAMVLRTKLVGDIRRFTFRDPNLPIELQPEGWPGREVYELFRRIHAQLGPQANEFVESVIEVPLQIQPLLRRSSTPRKSTTRKQILYGTLSHITG